MAVPTTVRQSALRNCRQATPAIATSTPRDRAELVARFRAVLASKNLTVNHVSKESERLYGSCSSYFIPHDFCYSVASPRICQFVSLSKITGYSLVDLLLLFGFVPDEILRLQVKLHAERTVLLPSVLYDKNKEVPFLGGGVHSEEFRASAPFASRAIREPFVSAQSIEMQNRQSFLYAKIGERDNFAFPELVPGSIVRVDPRRTNIEAALSQSGGNRPIYLIEHSGGLTCTHVSRAQGNRIFLVPHALPLGCQEFYLGRDAVVLGTVDAELRPMRGLHRPDSNGTSRSILGPQTRNVLAHPASLGELLRLHRERSGMSFRRTSEMSAQIAEELGDREYSLSPASLYKLEVSESIPRHIPKLFSLCILYSLDLWTLLRSAGIPVQEAGHDPLPNHFLPHRRRPTSMTEIRDQVMTGTLSAYLAEILGEIPLFLASAWSHLIPGRAPTPGELFWFGQSEDIFHPLLRGARLLAIDAQCKNGSLDDTPWGDLWQRPLMLILTRIGRYVCGFCSVNRDTITVEPHPDCRLPAVRFRNGIDADLIGKVVALARLFP